MSVTGQAAPPISYSEDFAAPSADAYAADLEKRIERLENKVEYLISNLLQPFIRNDEGSGP